MSTMKERAIARCQLYLGRRNTEIVSQTENMQGAIERKTDATRNYLLFPPFSR